MLALALAVLIGSPASPRASVARGASLEGHA